MACGLCPKPVEDDFFAIYEPSGAFFLIDAAPFVAVVRSGRLEPRTGEALQLCRGCARGLLEPVAR